MNPVVSERTTTFCITAVDVRKQLRSFDTSEDALLDTYIGAAVKNIENRLHSTIQPCTYTFTVAGNFPPVDSEGLRPIELYRPPVTAVESVTYINTDGETVLMVDDVDYYVSGDAIYPVTDWPDSLVRERVGQVTIVYTAGRATPDDDLKLIIAATAAAFSKNREAITALDIKELPNRASIERMLDAYRNVQL